MNEKIADTLGVLDPRLGAIYNSSTEGINNLLEGIATTQQDAVERYLRAATNQLVSAAAAGYAFVSLSKPGASQ
jgi:hypothetical protein